MHNHKNRAFLLKNHILSVLGSTQLQSLTLKGKTWQWLEAGDPRASQVVVLLHGLSMSKNHWRTSIPLLAKHYRVIVPDVPGFKVGFPANDPSLGFEGIAKELSDFLSVVVGKPTHLVGHSMSATLALGLALRMPVPVQSISLVSLADVNLTEGLSVELQFRKMSEFILGMTQEQHINYVRAMFYHPPPAVKLMAKNSWQSVDASRRQIADLFYAMEQEFSFVEQYGKSLNIPLLVVNGKQDLWKDLTRMSDLFSQPNVTRVELDFCRHLPFIERPIEFSEALLSFLEQTNGFRQRQVS
jgi:pimeloyl-ACP methyl ester carboxylesterase